MLKKTSITSREFEEAGKTLIEILGVLAIMGLLSVTGLLSYKYALRKKLINDLIYVTNTSNIIISQTLENRTFSDTSELNLFLSHYTQFVENYKVSFYAIEDSHKNKFGTNIELSDGSNMPPAVCKDLILAMQNQRPLQAIDVKASEQQRHIEASTIDVNTLCGR